MKQHFRTTTYPRAIFWLAVAGLSFAINALPPVCPSYAQLRANRPVMLRVGVNGSVEKSADETAGTAALKTDPDLESLLDKAKRYQDDGNYSVASQLWQAVLERCGDTLYSRDEKTYYSMVDQVERTLSVLPPEALKVYRINADAEAKQILARAGKAIDIQALSEVVRRYFVSSIGDDAAFSLAAVYIDRYDFVGALRLLEKIRDRHPDPSIPQADLLSRIAFCHALVGDREAAATLIADMKKLGSESGDMADNLEKLLQKSPEQLSDEFALMSLSTFRSFRVQPSLPSDYFDGELIGNWQFLYEINAAGNFSAADVEGRVLQKDAESIATVSETESDRELELIKSWQEHFWRPATVLIVEGDQVFFKSAANLSSWSTDLTDTPLWRSLWCNRFEEDDATMAMESIRNSYGRQMAMDTKKNGRRAPQSTNELLFFGDEIHAQMAKIGDVIYTVEGKHFDSSLPANAQRKRGFQYNAAFRRTRTNFLVAYEADSGRVLWTLPKNSGSGFRSTDEPKAPNAPEKKDDAWLTSGGFMGGPVPYNDLIISPVNMGGAIYVYGLDAKDGGRTVWKTYLCDEPETGAASLAPITLTIDGSDLFVASGMGVVFVLDPATGMIRFAQRYDRIGQRNKFLQNFGWQVSRMDFDGWSEDIAIPYGRQLICFCSDSDKIFAIDRSTAETVWQVEMNPLGQKVDYLIGIHNDVLFTGGSQTIIAFDLLGEGRMLWGGDAMFDEGTSLGKALLCVDGLYVPVDDTIMKYDVSNKNGQPQVLGKVHVNLGTSAPCGNLSSDGRRIWVNFANRLVALGKAEVP